MLIMAVPPNGSPPAVVTKGDRNILIGIAILGCLILVLFAIALYWSGLIAPLNTNGDLDSIYNEALYHREKRLILALILRTFLISFSFVIGLLLCTMGGLFILRQVRSLTSFSIEPGQGEGKIGDFLKGSVKFEAYSPGVVFMVGGVLIIWLTQYLAIPISTSAELVPPQSSLIGTEATPVCERTPKPQFCPE